MKNIGFELVLVKYKGMPNYKQLFLNMEEATLKIFLLEGHLYTLYKQLSHSTFALHIAYDRYNISSLRLCQDMF